MIRKSTWIVLGVFAVLLAALLLMQKTGNLEFSGEPTSSPTQASVFSIDTGGISFVRVAVPEGDSAEFKKNSDGSWSAVAPEGFQPDPAEVKSALDQVSLWTIQDELSVAPPLDAVRLNDPLYLLNIRMDSGQEHTISVGILNPAQTGYYLRLDGGSPFLVSRYTVDPVLKLLDLLQITPAAPPAETAVPVTTPAS